VIVVGLDPSVRRVGYAVLRCSMSSNVEILDLGVWHLHRFAEGKASVGSRLELLHAKAVELLGQWNPRWVGIERAVTFKNPQSALSLSEARGVLRLACYQILDNMDDRLVELSPTAIKKSTAGWGRSSKEDMLRALELRFSNLTPFVESLQGLEKITHDAYDALGIAWATWVQLRQKLRVGVTLQS
jgi:crossover junction endodeoxyribonuclease RuvC